MSDSSSGDEVEVILGEQDINGTTYYHIKWKGYGSDNDTFKLIEHLTDCPAILDAYLEKWERIRPKSVTASEKKGKWPPQRAKRQRKRTPPKRTLVRWKRNIGSADDRLPEKHDFDVDDKPKSPLQKSSPREMIREKVEVRTCLESK
jgi:hypothetical protein